MQNTIICLDDEPMILDSLRGELLRSFGGEYDCEVAESAEEAMEMLDQQASLGMHVVAVVSDWLMPGMKGDEFLDAVHQKYPEVARVLLTGYAQDQVVQGALKRGAMNRCLGKPWLGAELVRCIRDAIRESHQAPA